VIAAESFSSSRLVYRCSTRLTVVNPATINPAILWMTYFHSCSRTFMRGEFCLAPRLIGFERITSPSSSAVFSQPSIAAGFGHECMTTENGPVREPVRFLVLPGIVRKNMSVRRRHAWNCGSIGELKAGKG
jgi:hypothetical protein